MKTFIHTDLKRGDTCAVCFRGTWVGFIRVLVPTNRQLRCKVLGELDRANHEPWYSTSGAVDSIFDAKGCVFVRMSWDEWRSIEVEWDISGVHVQECEAALIVARMDRSDIIALHIKTTAQEVAAS